MRTAGGGAALPEPLQLSPTGINPIPQQPSAAGERQGEKKEKQENNNTIYRCLAEANACLLPNGVSQSPGWGDLLADRSLSQLDFCQAELWAPSAEDRPHAAHGVPRSPRSAKRRFSWQAEPSVLFLCSVAAPLICPQMGILARGEMSPRPVGSRFSAGVTRTPSAGKADQEESSRLTGCRMVFQKPQPARNYLWPQTWNG